MTREEAKEILENWKICHYTPSREAAEVIISALDPLEIITALRPVSREPLEKFKEYFDDLYGKGLEVYGWHMNGEAKSFDDFYEDACEYAGL